MVAELRRQPGTASVTCYTCHRAQPRPQATPPLAGDPATVAAADASTPSLSEVLRRHRQATGDDARLQRLSSLAIAGRAIFTRLGVATEARTFAVVARPPERWVRTDGKRDDAMSVGVSGVDGWRRFGTRVLPLGGIDLAQAQREAQLAAVGDVAAPYQRLTVAGRADVHGAPAIVVDAVARQHRLGPLAIESEQLFFDAHSGLLVRRRLVVRTALGALASGIDYSDFRTVDGVQLPFRIERLFPGAVETLVVDDPELDVPLPDERFTPPAVR